MSLVSTIIDLGTPGLVIGELTINCQRSSDRSLISSVGCTLIPFGTSGRYWLSNPNIEALTGFEVYVTLNPDNYFIGEFSPYDTVVSSALPLGVLIDLGLPGLTKSDITITSMREFDLFVVSTSAFTLIPIGSTGRYWLVNPLVSSRVGFEVVVNTWPEKYAIGVFDPQDYNPVAPGAGLPVSDAYIGFMRISEYQFKIVPTNAYGDGPESNIVTIPREL